VTKAQAIERVKKLLALAKGSKEPNERASAERRAAELKTKFSLSDADLQTSDKVAAFDELVGIIGEYSSKHPELQQNMFGAAQIIEEVLAHSKKNLAGSHKAVLLDKISSGIEVASFLIGNSNRTLNDIREIVESVLKSHNL
jgi:glycyl-tRNA synthetase beta subunit